MTTTPETRVVHDDVREMLIRTMGCAVSKLADGDLLSELADDFLVTAKFVLSAPAAPVGWPEPKFVPMGAGMTLNPARPEYGYQLLKELTLGEMFKVVEMICDGTEYTLVDGKNAPEPAAWVDASVLTRLASATGSVAVKAILKNRHLDFEMPSKDDRPLYAAPPAPVAASAVDWAVGRWIDEVKHRPLRNTHRRSLDDTWRQVIRHFGGDPDALLGPSHDDLVAANPSDAVRDPVAASAMDEPEWKEDPASDERWSAGLLFGLEQLCGALGVDRNEVAWDAGTDTLDGDVQSVISSIFRAHTPNPVADNPAGDPVVNARSALAELERACDDIASVRSQTAYLELVDAGHTDVIERLDAARAEARRVLACLESGQGWRSMSELPVGQYALLKVTGSNDAEFPGVAVGRKYQDGKIWLTCGWAGSTYHGEASGWLPLTPAAEGSR